MDDLAEILELDDAGNPLQGRIVQIFQVACRLFAHRGFDGVSMRDIAAECGISKATLYHYFPGKDSILRPLAMGTTKSIFLHVQKYDDPTAPPLVRLRVFLVESANFFEKFRWAWIASSTAFWSDPKVRARKERIAWRDKYEQLLRDILQAGVDRGEIRVDDVRLAGRFVLSTINWMARWFDPDGPLTAAQVGDQFCNMIVNGIGAAQRPAPKEAVAQD
nr:TetR/AcrR family transcriptional regulator [uncultured Roseococcus sp.]